MANSLRHRHFCTFVDTTYQTNTDKLPSIKHQSVGGHYFICSIPYCLGLHNRVCGKHVAQNVKGW